MAVNLRKEARGRDCQIRIPGVCNKNPETTVLAHLNDKRMFGAGIGQKPPDIFGAHSCSACHDAVDGRLRPVPAGDGFFYEPEEIRILFYEGVFRTQGILLKEGKI